MYHFIEILDIDELVDISNLSEAEQDQFMLDFIEATVADTYTDYLQDPDIPADLKDKLTQAVDNNQLTPEEHQQIFASSYLQTLYQECAYRLKLRYLHEFLSDLATTKYTLEPDVEQVFKDSIEYLTEVVNLPETQQEPELEVVEVWKNFKAICIAKLDMFKE